MGCCDSSPSQHASKHAAATGHPIITSFEPGEDWFFDYEKQEMIKGVELLPPHSHPKNQPAPGPAGRVPANWESLLHQLPVTGYPADETPPLDRRCFPQHPNLSTTGGSA